MVGEITRTLLRHRLLWVSAFFALAAFGALIVNATQAVLLPTWAVGLGLLVFLGAMGSISFKPDLPLALSRLLELVIFGTAALLLAAHAAIYFGDAFQSSSAVATTALLHREALIFVLLVAIYGVFIPNSTLRAAAVTVPLASLFPLAFLISLSNGQTPSLDLPFYGLLAESFAFLAGGTLIAIGAAALASSHQSASLDAKDMGLYSLKEKIGAGGMGEVWLAQHQMLSRPAAIKIIRPEILKNGDRTKARSDRTLARFEKEARATASLRSPHTVEVYDFGRTDHGVFYYVMEYLEGLDFQTLVQRHGPMPPQRAVFLLRQACESLGEAHSGGLIHRDLKPANLFACRLGLRHDFVKVLDFGLVKDQEESQEALKLTVEGTTTGTPAFMAPEMALGSDNCDSRTDIYSLGCVAYWMLTAQTVFERTNLVAMALDHVQTEPYPPSARTEIEIPSELDEIVLKCLEKRPEDRYQTAIDLGEALEGCPLPEPWNRRQASEWWRIHSGHGNGRSR